MALSRMKGLIFHFLVRLAGKYLNNGPMFLSDSESDSDDEADSPRNKRPIREPQLLKKSLSYNGPPPPYTVDRTSGENTANMSSKARRAMQNL